jgi:hypothetical protein
MAASRFTRNKDYSQDQVSNTGGRGSVDTAGLDGEFDELLAVTDDHATKIDVVVRDDGLLLDDLILGHEFSPQALAVMASYMGAVGVLIPSGAWLTATVYPVGSLVFEGVSTYLCVIAHTSGVFATDLAALKWRVFAQGSSGLPTQATHAGKALVTNGSVESWSKITSGHVDGTVAPAANPVFIGKNKDDGSVMTGKSYAAITSGAPTFNIDFDGKAHQTASVENNATFTTSNRAAAFNEVKVVDIIMWTGVTGYTLTFPAGWNWVTAKPASIPSGSLAVLSLRCIGVNDTDVIAAYAVGP